MCDSMGVWQYGCSGVLMCDSMDVLDYECVRVWMFWIMSV